MFIDLDEGFGFVFCCFLDYVCSFWDFVWKKKFVWCGFNDFFKLCVLLFGLGLRGVV